MSRMARWAFLTVSTVILLAAAVDAQEVVEQWVLAVAGVSSLPTTTAGAAAAIIGPPNSTCETGDSDFDFDSWRPLEADGGEESLAPH